MGVALITPFKSDGSVDYNALVRLVEYQVQNGVDFLCVLGTTAETPTLTEEEKRQIKKVVIERVNGLCQFCWASAATARRRCSTR